MNIGDFVKANAASRYLSGSAGAQAATQAGAAASGGLQKAQDRIQAQVDTNTAQLSSFGKLKSSVSQAQVAARALGSLSSTTTSAAEKTAATQFVSTFNTATGTAKTTAAVPGETTVASNSAGRVNKDLRRALGPDTATVNSLSQIGFSLNPDGNLALDSKKFDAAQKADPTAVRATLTQLGKRVDKAATQELAASGNVEATLSSLNQRSSTLKSQQGSLASLGSFSSASSSGSATGGFRFGIGAYQNS